MQNTAAPHKDAFPSYDALGALRDEARAAGDFRTVKDCSAVISMMETRPESEWYVDDAMRRVQAQCRPLR